MRCLCLFAEPSVGVPKQRLVAAALSSVAGLLENDGETQAARRMAYFAGKYKHNANTSTRLRVAS